MGELHDKYHRASVCVRDLDRACAFDGSRLGLEEFPRPKAPRTRRMEASRR